MQVVYANQPLPASWTKSIFLAGPTPRSKEVRSWRPDALSFLDKIEYDGVVFVPEDEKGKWQHSYVDQVEWEERCLTACDCIVFWIPRELKTMPGFTTNIELGVWFHSGKIVVGFPKRAPKTRYIDYYTKKLKVLSAHSLNETLEKALELIKNKNLKIITRDTSWETGRLYLPMNNREANQLIKSSCPQCGGPVEAEPRIECAVLNSGTNKTPCKVDFACYNQTSAGDCDYSWTEKVVLKLTIEIVE